ncbi:hypothetical protein AMECASPLE_032222 [Ameca splendens]|uniref:Uncharacterized protein n=1 Tax=Ameca splendens TaxID=208324 RepID=A0ABV0YHY5_9TELE
MTPSHSSHFLNLDPLTTLSSPLSQSPVSRQIPAGGPKSSPGQGLCVSAEDSTVFPGIYRPTGTIRRCWNPARKDQINIRFKQPNNTYNNTKRRERQSISYFTRFARRNGQSCF